MRLFTNNAIAQLASGITDVATSMSVKAGEGALFPAISGAPDHFFVTLSDASNNIEIVKVTARSTDTMTIVRAQDGTSERAWSADDNVELAVTANHLQAALQVGMVRGFIAGGGSADAITATFSNATDVSLENGMTFLVESAAANATATPTFTVTLGSTAQSAKTIVKGADKALAPGDIPGASYTMILSYDASLDKFVLLNPYFPPLVVEAKAALFTLAVTDNGKMFDCTGSWTLTVPAASTLGNGFSCFVYNSGTGVITLSTGDTVNPGEVTRITSDGTNIRELRSSKGFTRVEVLTSSNASWTVPDNVYRIKATVVGGGGGGSGFNNSGSPSSGTGGGGGGTSIKVVAVTPGDTIAVTVGAGGGGGGTGASGSAGGTSSFGGHCSATGGGGGVHPGFGGTGGAGGSGSGGDLNLVGSDGGQYFIADGNNKGKAGGASSIGGGGNGSTGGNAGNNYGGGGQGGGITNGGAGAGGVVILEY